MATFCTIYTKAYRQTNKQGYNLPPPKGQGPKQASHSIVQTIIHIMLYSNSVATTNPSSKNTRRLTWSHRFILFDSSSSYTRHPSILSTLFKVILKYSIDLSLSTYHATLSWTKWTTDWRIALFDTSQTYSTSSWQFEFEQISFISILSIQKSNYKIELSLRQRPQGSNFEVVVLIMMSPHEDQLICSCMQCIALNSIEHIDCAACWLHCGRITLHWRRSIVCHNIETR